MALSVQHFDGPLDELPRFIEAASVASETAGGMAASGTAAIELLGPFPTYTADPREIAEGKWDSVEHSGWRALARRGGKPLGVVGIVELEGRPIFSLRDADAAQAFATALAAATRLEAEGRDYEVRWFALPAIYLTALWLKGDEDLFLPTRAGSAERTNLDAVSRQRIEQMAAELVEQFSRGQETRVSGDFVEGDADTRSGL